MPAADSAAAVATHYYKLACLQLVTYTVYTATDPAPDQVLLELELRVRAEHPRILLAYSNKCLYHFRLGHWRADEPACGALPAPGGPTDLRAAYPQLTRKHEAVVSAQRLASPAPMARSRNGAAKDAGDDEYLPYASLLFTKAVKKLVVHNMAAGGAMHVFGNGLLGRPAPGLAQYRVVQVDPVLLPSGEVWVLVTQRARLALLDTSTVDLDHVIPGFAASLAIYVVPSGLRCHLYDLTNMRLSFSTTPPKSAATLLRLVRACTGLDLAAKPTVLWVKLVPNLQHLNNNTASVARFVHDVDNRKYILWPWELCVLQFGSAEALDVGCAKGLVLHPLALINDYLAYSLSVHETAHPEISPPPPAAASSGPGFVPAGMAAGSYPSSVPGAPFTLAPAPVLGEQEAAARHLLTPAQARPSSTLDGIETQYRLPADSSVHATGSGPGLHIDTDDELFGASSDLDPCEPPPSGGSGAASTSVLAVAKAQSASPQSTTAGLLKGTPGLEDTLEAAMPHKQPLAGSLLPELNSEAQRPPEPAGYTGIPKNEMISAEIRQCSPRSYDDPGAPPPLVPTPALSQHSSFGISFQGTQLLFPYQGSQHQNSGLHISHASNAGGYPAGFIGKTGGRGRRHLDSAAAWAFSPIVFNPKIKNSIDTKYGKGGKFYVDKEESSGPELEPRRPRLRETSVLAYDLNLLQEASSLPRFVDSSLSNPEGALRIGTNSETMNDGGIRQGTESEMAEFSGSGSLSKDVNKTEDENRDLMDDNEDALDEDSNEEDEEDESDEDADSDVAAMASGLSGAALKLNTQSNDFFATGSQDQIQDALRAPELAVSLLFPLSDVNSAQISPGSGLQKAPRNRNSSPFGLGIESNTLSLSPFPGAEKAGVSPRSAPVQLNLLPESKSLQQADILNGSSSGSSIASETAESSNCLPLILRSINVQSIPNMFLLNKVPGAWGAVSMASGFDMDVDDEDDDIEHKDAGLSVKVKHMDEMLRWLVPNLVFDSGLTSFDYHTQLRVPDFFSEEVCTGLADDSATRETARIFKAAFPQSHIVSLKELLIPPAMPADTPVSSQDLKIHIPFLDEMAIDEQADMGYASAIRDTPLPYWDSFLPIETSQFMSEKPKKAKIDENAAFLFDDVKVKVCKNQKDVINLNFIGLRFWKYFNFSPVAGPKKFQVLMLTENQCRHDSSPYTTSADADFLDSLKYNYEDMRLGCVKKLNLQTFETRPDLEGISNGILVIDKDMGERSYNDFYKRSNRKLKNLAELIKLDLINRTNRFEFDRPLLLLFVDCDESINSVLQIAKICRNFKVSLRNHQLSLVEVFAHVIPSSHIFKKSPNGRGLKYLSDSKLARISTILYNKCPNHNLKDLKLPARDQSEPPNLYSQLVKDTPTSLNFKFLSRLSKESLNSENYDDMFLHVAYERSVDKKWICAAWSDPLGIVTHTESWYCPPTTKLGLDKDVHDLGSIIFNIWEISNKLFKKLNEDILLRTCSSGKKKFLVLARVSSIIPDDELLHWKRLTAKYKDVSLIVLTTNRVPKYLFKTGPIGDLPTFTETNRDTHTGFDEQENVLNTLDKKMPKPDGSDFTQSFDGSSATHQSTSPSGSIAISTSPMSNALTFHSPQQFVNAPSSIFLAPDARSENLPADADCILKDTTFDIIGMIPKVPLPSCNSPTRYSMRTGFLMKESLALKNAAVKEYVVFELSLLSCSNYWNLDTVMKITLKQFKKLIALNEVLGVYDRAVASKDGSRKARETELQALVPWHVNAVVKALDYLIHVHVD